MATITTPQFELPELVHEYLQRVLPASARDATTVRLAQRGTIRLKPDGRDLAFRAVEELSSRDVAFSWEAKVRIAPLLALRVVDGLDDGEGSLKTTLLGVAVVRSRGDDTSVGEAMRYLAELPWVPQAILANRHLHWSVVDERIVEVDAPVAGTTASIGFRFDEQGDVRAAFGHRPHLEGKKTVVRPWIGLYSDYAEIGGIRIPTRAEVHWELPDGPLTYFRGEIVGVEL
jgi:Family of unknown function (DUF6544)